MKRFGQGARVPVRLLVVAAFLLGLLIGSPHAATPALGADLGCEDFEDLGPIVYKKKGEPVDLCVPYPAELKPKVDYFRVRRSQTQAGSYSQFARISPSISRLTFAATIPCHIFITVVWKHPLPDGSTEILETPGSHHIEIKIIPP